jgi:hypothetical protein
MKSEPLSWTLLICISARALKLVTPRQTAMILRIKSRIVAVSDGNRFATGLSMISVFAIIGIFAQRLTPAPRVL